MNTNNPYEPPQPYGSPLQGEVPAPMNRTPFILAGIGALAASAYWAALTLLLGVGIATGSASFVQIILPVVLIVLYALRGFQLFKGDPLAAKRILWLHIVGGVMSAIVIASGSTMVIVLYGIKLLIHAFGAVTAYLATRAYKESQGYR